MSNVTESDCCAECRKNHTNCVEGDTGNPTHQAWCDRVYKECKEQCGDC